MSGLMSLEILTAGLMLFIAMVSDIMFKKVRNNLVIAMFSLSIAVVLFSQGLSSSASIFSSFATALVIGLPLYLLKIFGGGDFKLLLGISPLLTWKAIAIVIATSFVWGGLLGLFRAILAGQAKILFLNVIGLFSKEKPNESQLHMIPFTVAIFFGFLTYLSLSQINYWEAL